MYKQSSSFGCLETGYTQIYWTGKMILVHLVFRYQIFRQSLGRIGGCAMGVWHLRESMGDGGDGLILDGKRQSSHPGNHIHSQLSSLMGWRMEHDGTSAQVATVQLAAEAKAELNCRDLQLRKLWRGFTVNWKEMHGNAVDWHCLDSEIPGIPRGKSAHVCVCM